MFGRVAMFGHRRGLLLALGACWWPADRRCEGEQPERRWLSRGASSGRWQPSWAGCFVGALFHTLVGVELLLQKQTEG